jgi:hypothetical protein
MPSPFRLQRWSAVVSKHGPTWSNIGGYLSSDCDGSWMFLTRSWERHDVYSSQRFVTPETWSCLVLDYWLMAWFWWQRWQRWQPRILSAVRVFLSMAGDPQWKNEACLAWGKPCGVRRNCEGNKGQPIAEGWCVCWGATVPVSLSTSAEFSTKVVACCGRILYIRYH